ncbi:expressed protein [Phakopsora pachyrhizi]|uniref:Expressed protein n=1 Tax=Phakopsora pachyrhizi TaxID=170000 RepID=A0AAV0B0J8_PHAPC|nr:expressed protein [Phakopsora pachyrhizi]
MKMLPIVSGFENTWDFFDRKVVLDLLASELQHSFSERFLDDEFLKSTFKNAKSYSGLLFSMSKMHFLNFLSTITYKTIYNILREKLLIQAGSKKEEIHNRKRLVEDLLKIKILPNIRSTEDSNEGRRTYITLFYVLQYLIFKGKTEIKFERFEGKKLYKLLEIILFYINRNFKRSQFSRIMSRYRRESKPFTEGLNEVEKQSAIYKLSQDVQTLCYCFSGDTENFEVFMYYLSRDTSSRDHHYQSEAVSFKRPA